MIGKAISSESYDIVLLNLALDDVVVRQSTSAIRNVGHIHFIEADGTWPPALNVAIIHHPQLEQS